MSSKHYVLMDWGKKPLNAELEIWGQGCDSIDRMLDSLQKPAFGPLER